MLSGMNEILDTVFLGNSLKNFVTFAAAFLAGIILVSIFKRIILRRLIDWSKKTETSIDDFILLSIKKRLVPLAFIGVLYLSLGILKLNSDIVRFIELSWVIVFSFVLVMMISGLVDYSLNTYSGKEGNPRIPKGMVTLARGIIWIFGLIFILDNLGFSVSTVIAGLGIGGVAVAMASQTILKDLFNYFVIIFDKPFENGDLIEFDSFSGSVEHIGIKTTRLRMPGGEQLVISNSHLTDSRIRNYKRMNSRTVVFTIGVGCDTDNGKLKGIPAAIEDIIARREDTEFHRAHFRKFSEYTLDFEIVYSINTVDFTLYLDIQQEINLEIKERLEKEGVNMPYPTREIVCNNIGTHS